MLRLLFTNQDNSKQLTAITDGIDSQLNVFVTENTVGDIDYFKSVGIVIEPGMMYNIGLLKEWAYLGPFRLISYPEGLNDQSQILVDFEEEYEYTFTITPTELSFANTGETKQVTITSTRQKMINGEAEGDPEEVSYTAINLVNVTVNQNSITMAENPAEEQHIGSVTYVQDISKKEVIINCTQAASVITYEYALTTSPTSLSFVAAGESKSFEVTSTKQKKLNGNNIGGPITVGYGTTVTGTGFSKGANDTTVIAAVNPDATERSGSVTVSPQEGGKTASITLTQAGTTV